MAAVDRAQEPRGARPGRHPFFWVAAALGLLVLGFYAFAASAYLRYGQTLVDLDWSAAYERGAWYVTSVEPGGPADGLLRTGDRVLSVVLEGSHPDRPAEVVLGGIRAGDLYRVRVEREGQPLDVAVAAPATIDRRMLRFTLSFSVVSLAFYVVALLLGLRRPDLWIGRLGCIAFLVEAVGFASMPLDPIRPFFAGWERTVDLFVVATQPFQPVLAYHFFRSFPKPMEQARVWRALTYVLYAAAALFVVPNVLIFRQLFEPGAYRFEFMSENTGLIMAYFGVFRLYLVGGLVAAYAVLIRNYFAEESDLERRRIKWVVYASAASVIPFGALHAADFVAVGLGYRSILANVENFGLLYVVTSAFVLIPLSIGYAILKHRIFDIHVVVRLGVRYLLARGVLEATLTLPVALLAISILQNPELTVAELFRRNSVYLYLIIGVVVSLSVRSRLGEWVDRRFFRAAYDREQILVGLVEEIKERDSIGDISRHVSAELEAALYPSRMILLFRQEGAPRLMIGYSSGERAEDFLLAGDAQLMYVFAGETDAQDVPAESDRIPEHELRLLHDFGITLVVPMTGSDDQIVGLLLLGEKRSEEPYSPRDRSLLEAVAAQIAIVYENSQLKTRVARDRRIRVEVLGRIDSERINLLRECPACGTCYDSAASRCAVDAAELTLTLPVERTIDGKYRLDRLIGRGGMGAVYEGTDLRLERRVAVKIMTGRSFGDRDALRRFQREARASARLSHPNIVQIYDYGTLGESGAYLVLELLRGRTLRQLVVASGCLMPRDAARIFEQIFDGMHAAHAAGVVHRDLKPENVLVVAGEEECVKILDFGLAKMTAADVADTSSITVPGTIMGTFGYMSPEQLNGAESDRRADIFALGVMLYEALTGRKPFAGRNWGDLLASIANGPASLPGGSPEAKRLEALLGRCLAEEPAERFPSVAEARDALIPAVLACEPFCEPTAVVEEDDAAPTAVLGENAPRV